MEPKLSREEMYAVLEERHTPQVQEKLRKASVAVAGIGGIGSNIAIMLARIGIGKLHLVDFDLVDTSNLNRQQYFMEQLGRPKTEALQETLRHVNPYVTVVIDTERVTKENCTTLFAEENIICEAFDRPEAKAMLAEEILCHCPDKILIAASGMAGYGDSNAIRTRKINQRFYLCGDETSDSGAGLGLMAPRVTICAAHQANMVVECILHSQVS